MMKILSKGKKFLGFRCKVAALKKKGSMGWYYVTSSKLELEQLALNFMVDLDWI